MSFIHLCKLFQAFSGQSLKLIVQQVIYQHLLLYRFKFTSHQLNIFAIGNNFSIGVNLGRNLN